MLRIPEMGSDLPDQNILPKRGEAYIENPAVGKKYLTTSEALEVINKLSGLLALDERNRKA